MSGFSAESLEMGGPLRCAHSKGRRCCSRRRSCSAPAAALLALPSSGAPPGACPVRCQEALRLPATQGQLRQRRGVPQQWQGQARGPGGGLPRPVQRSSCMSGSTACTSQSPTKAACCPSPVRRCAGLTEIGSPLTAVICYSGFPDCSI